MMVITMWIESHQSLRNHPKVKKAARLAGVSECEMIGLLHYLWWWSMDYAPDGDLTKYTDDDIEDAVDWHGERGLFVKALTECSFNGHSGLIDVVAKKGRKIHDWYEYAGKLIERRAEDAERKRNARRKSSVGHPEDGEETAHVPNQPNQPNIPNQPDNTDHGADKPREPLTPTQQKVLSSFNAKRFKNDIQRDAILAWSSYPQGDVEAAITWAATKGFSLGQAIENINRALPKWNAPKKNGNGHNSGSTGSPMLDAILEAQKDPNYGK